MPAGPTRTETDSFGLIQGAGERYPCAGHHQAGFGSPIGRNSRKRPDHAEAGRERVGGIKLRIQPLH